MAENFYTHVNFTGESSCVKFVPNRFRANMCVTCSKEISKHNRSSIQSKEVLMRALEYTQSMDKLGSVIIPTDDTTERGGLYLGGYRASINQEFLQNQHITHILNVAAGLVNFFGPKYEKSVKKIVKELHIDYLTLSWDDDAEFEIPIDDVIHGMTFIHNARTNGNVFVHCAQGKSRSSTIVVAYVMAFMNLSLEKALEFVQEGRKMAQPNPGFMKLLAGLNNDEKFISFSQNLADKHN
ncbi:dual specificity protein phosphatase 1B-like [Dendronephthya gigantea]|uniref:dual specificity protein phosphatase 1B-like n=1 Tax=Dendronephthya gigantea TaxID=151771 RepID=UPI001069A829|nr:dual specificity protein phosphatase 1B-like [Dendronephthya gigantea]